MIFLHTFRSLKLFYATPILPLGSIRKTRQCHSKLSNSLCSNFTTPLFFGECQREYSPRSLFTRKAKLNKRHLTGRQLIVKITPACPLPPLSSSMPFSGMQLTDYHLAPSSITTLLVGSGLGKQRQILFGIRQPGIRLPHWLV